MTRQNLGNGNTYNFAEGYFNKYRMDWAFSMFSLA